MNSVDFSSLKNALPYIKAFRDRLFVIKLGGELCEDSKSIDQIVEQLSLLHLIGIKLVLVHGGGKQATELGDKLGVPSEFVSGRRVTSAEMLEVAKMSFAGKLNTDIIAAFKKAGIPAVGMSGIDGNLVKARRRPPTKITDDKDGAEREVDFGFVADIDSVQTDVLHHLFSGGYVPVICSLGSDEAGQILNINADTLASRIAASSGAIKLIVLGSVDGVLRDLKDPNTLYSVLNANDVQSLIRDKVVSGGMIPKLSTSLDAISRGVPKVHIVSGTRPNSVLQEIFTNEGSGTMIVPSA